MRCYARMRSRQRSAWSYLSFLPGAQPGGQTTRYCRRSQKCGSQNDANIRSVFTARHIDCAVRMQRTDTNTHISTHFNRSDKVAEHFATLGFNSYQGLCRKECVGGIKNV